MAMMTEMKAQGISTRWFIGKDVIGSTRDKIGEIDDVILNSNTGCAMFAVVDEGGFMGVGERHHVVPWTAFSWTAEEQLMVPFDRDKLVNAPVLDRTRMPDWGDESWQRTIYDYYGISYESTMMGGGMTGQGTTAGQQGTMPSGGTQGGGMQGGGM